MKHNLGRVQNCGLAFNLDVIRNTTLMLPAAPSCFGPPAPSRPNALLPSLVPMQDLYVMRRAVGVYERIVRRFTAQTTDYQKLLSTFAEVRRGGGRVPNGG